MRTATFPDYNVLLVTGNAGIVLPQGNSTNHSTMIILFALQSIVTQDRHFPPSTNGAKNVSSANCQHALKSKDCGSMFPAQKARQKAIAANLSKSYIVFNVKMSLTVITSASKC